MAKFTTNEDGRIESVLQTEEYTKKSARLRVPLREGRQENILDLWDGTSY